MKRRGASVHFWPAALCKCRLAAAGAFVGFSLIGCTDRAADLQIRLNALEDELNRTKAELDAANRTPPAAIQPSQPSKETSAMPTRVEIEQNYDRGLREFRDALQQKFSDGKINGVTAYQPKIEDKPYHGEFSLEASIGSRLVRLERIPIEGGLDGKWTFPSVAEVTDRLRQMPDASRSTAAAAATPTKAATDQTSVTAPSPADRTVTISWGDQPAANAPRSSGTTSSAPAAPAAAPAPAPAAPSAPSAPVKMMPTNRDVRIKF